MSAPPRATIAIINWNTKELVLNCLRTAALAVGNLSYECLVVDNASTDGSAAFLREKFPQARVIAHTENRGYAAAVNTALKEARGEYLFLLNSDTLLEPLCLAALVEFLESHPSAGCAAPKLRNADRTYQPSTNRFFPSPLTLVLYKVCFYFTIRQRLRETLFRGRKDPRKRPTRIAWAGGSALLFRKKALTAVNGFDESYFMYMEETDCLRRMTEAGRAVWYVPEAEVVHLGGASALTVSERTYFEIRRSELIYYRKFYGSIGFFTARFFLAYEACVRLLLGAVTAVILRNDRRRRRLKTVKDVLKMILTGDLELSSEAAG